MKLPILLASVLLLAACAETSQPETKASSEGPVVVAVAEYRQFYLLNNHDVAVVVKIENGSFEIARYYFYGTSSVYPFQEAYSRKWRGTFNEQGQVVVTYATCGAPQSISAIQATPQAILVGINGEALSLERLDGFTHWLHSTQGMTATEDVNCQFP